MLLFYRKPCSAKAANKSHLKQGDFAARVWKQKRCKMEKLVRWACTNRTTATGDVTMFILHKAKEQYDKWRSSKEFFTTLSSCQLNTMTFWKREQPDLQEPEIQELVSSAFSLFGAWTWH